MDSAVAVRERPILFSGRLVRAILEDRKSVTRRVMTPQPVHAQVYDWRGRRLYDGENRVFCWRQHVGADSWDPITAQLGHACPYGALGDRLWVRETWALPPSYDRERHGDLTKKPRIGPVCYREGYSSWDPWPGTRWRPSIHMPRWASRILLEVTEVRVERLQEITDEEAIAEGVARNPSAGYWSGAEHPVKGTPKCFVHPYQAFASLWDSLNAARGYGWDANPWVWVVRFRKVEPGAA